MPTSSGASAARSDELTLEMTRVLPAERWVVFRAFSDPNELARWWGPAGFSTPSLELQARVGERYRIEMQPPEGDRFYLTGEFREVDPPASPTRSSGKTLIPTTSTRWSTCHFGISVNRPRLPLGRARSRPRHVGGFTATAGRTASTSSSTSCPAEPEAGLGSGAAKRDRVVPPTRAMEHLRRPRPGASVACERPPAPSSHQALAKAMEALGLEPPPDTVGKAAEGNDGTTH